MRVLIRRRISFSRAGPPFWLFELSCHSPQQLKVMNRLACQTMTGDSRFLLAATIFDIAGIASPAQQILDAEQGFQNVFPEGCANAEQQNHDAPTEHDL